jgi:hypothetical protein
MNPRSLHKFVRKLQRNLQSNRFWKIWGGSLFIRRNSAGYALHLEGRDAGNPEISTSAAVFVIWSQAWKPRVSISFAELVLLVDGLGRFGNMTRRLASALCVAEYFGINQVLVPRPTIFQHGVFAESIHTFDNNLELNFGQKIRFRKRRVVGIWQEDFLLSPNVVEWAEKAPNAAWQNLASCLAFKPESISLSPRELVIHLRGGDVFSGRSPRSYGQPPLGFYQAVLDHQRWSKIFIVHEDSLNPVLEPLIRECQKQRIPVVSISQHLIEDLKFLLQAVSIVAGRGTFIPSVVGLSRVIQTVYFCEDKCRIMPHVPGVKLMRGTDSGGTYREQVLSRNWRNTPDQREMMISYPASNWNFVQQE